MKSSVPQGPMPHAPASSSYTIDPNQQQLKMSQLGISSNNLGSNMYASNTMGTQPTYNAQPITGMGSNNFSTMMPQYNNSMYPQTHSMQQTPSYEISRGQGMGQFASNPQASQISQQQYPMNQMNYPNSGIGQVPYMPSQQPIYTNNMAGGGMGSTGYPIQPQQPPNNLFYPSQPTNMGNLGNMGDMNFNQKRQEMYSSCNIGILQQKNIYQPPNIPMSSSQQNKNTNLSSNNNLSKSTSNSDPFDFLN